jgi:catechol 2,3-dioxygenase-like lactoylglutathione lyase family enzyme
MSSSTEVLTAARREDIKLDGIAYLAVNVADLAAAKDFYCGLLGFTPEPDTRLPECGRHAVVATASGQRVALCQSDGFAPSAETGIHNGYRVTAQARQTILDRLAREKIEVLTYHEIRPAEAKDNCYVYDPCGNRLQLVVTDKPANGTSASLIQGIDHATLQAADVEWEEDFYARRLGLPIDCVVGWRTADYVLARAWKDGKEAMAPGQMRLDKRYSTIHGTDPVPRPNMQLFVKTGSETLGIYLANKHFLYPPEELLVGTPRVAFRVSRTALSAIATQMEADGYPTSGLVDHPSSAPARQSLYCKDLGGNFIEFCC